MKIIRTYSGLFLRLFFSFSCIVINIFSTYSQDDLSRCRSCDNQVVVVDSDVTIDVIKQTYTGNPVLFPHLIGFRLLDLGKKKLLVKNGAIIRINSDKSVLDRFIILTNCDIEIEQGRIIMENRLNKNGTDLEIVAVGEFIIGGEISNIVNSTQGIPGNLTLESAGGNILIHKTGLVQVIGTGSGGNMIRLKTCNSCNSEPNQGNIIIDGLVKSYALAHSGDQRLNRPEIKVVSLGGNIFINAGTTEPLYDEYSQNGTLYDIYGGLLSWVGGNVNPGNIELEAKFDIRVTGHGKDPTGPARKSFGAIAAIGTASDAPGGQILAQSLSGKITGIDHSFDISGRNRLAKNHAKCTLLADSNIELFHSISEKPVVDASSPAVGDKGGQINIQSFHGKIIVGPEVIISSKVPAGKGSEQGQNDLISCDGIINNGNVVPVDINPGNNLNICGSQSPIFNNYGCCQIDFAHLSHNRVLSSNVLNPGTLFQFKFLFTNTSLHKQDIRIPIIIFDSSISLGNLPLSPLDFKTTGYYDLNGNGIIDPTEPSFEYLYDSNFANIIKLQEPNLDSAHVLWNNFNSISLPVDGKISIIILVEMIHGAYLVKSDLLFDVETTLLLDRQTAPCPGDQGKVINPIGIIKTKIGLATITKREVLKLSEKSIQ